MLPISNGMKEFQRKQIIRRIVYSIPSLIILLITAFFLVKGTVRVMDKGWESSERSRDLEKRAAALILREEELKGDIARLQTEEGVRDEIKEKFSVTEEGEYVAVIVDDRKVSSSTDGSTLAWYKRFWNVIMLLND